MRPFACSSGSSRQHHCTTGPTIINSNMSIWHSSRTHDRPPCPHVRCRRSSGAAKQRRSPPAPLSPTLAAAEAVPPPVRPEPHLHRPLLQVLRRLEALRGGAQPRGTMRRRARSLQGVSPLSSAFQGAEEHSSARRTASSSSLRLRSSHSLLSISATVACICYFHNRHGTGLSGHDLRRSTFTCTVALSGDWPVSQAAWQCIGRGEVCRFGRGTCLPSFPHLLVIAFRLARV